MYDYAWDVLLAVIYPGVVPTITTTMKAIIPFVCVFTAAVTIIVTTVCISHVSAVNYQVLKYILHMCSHYYTCVCIWILACAHTHL